MIFKKKDAIPMVEHVRYKVTLVAKCFLQREWVAYNEVFSPVVKQTSITVVLSIVTRFYMHMEYMDVTTAFVHGDLEDVIYMKQP